MGARRSSARLLLNGGGIEGLWLQQSSGAPLGSSWQEQLSRELNPESEQKEDWPQLVFPLEKTCTVDGRAQTIDDTRRSKHDD